MTDLFDPPAETTWEVSRRQQVEELSAENRELRQAAAELMALQARVAQARHWCLVNDCDTRMRQVRFILDGDTPAGGWPYGGGA